MLVTVIMNWLMVEEDNPLAGSFSFGVYTNTEWGKGRGNQLTLQGVDANAEEANQKNDLYSYSLKMCRHASVMIDNQVFFRFIGDEQRHRKNVITALITVLVVKILKRLIKPLIHKIPYNEARKRQLDLTHSDLDVGLGKSALTTQSLKRGI